MPADQPHSPSPSVHPRILIVSRRSVRKNKFIDFVGEYHLDLLSHFGASPLILPRTPAPPNFLSSLPSFHGLLICEGEDIAPTFRPHEPPPPPHVQHSHPSDATPDLPKDHLEFQLVRHCLKQGIPVLGICRGCQVLNLCAGGSLLPDVDTALGAAVRHIDYDNYDAHRHPLNVVPETPLADWFDGRSRLAVNSYHHQGIDELGGRFVGMGYAPDGLVEAFYDPSWYDVERGRFLVGLQFHPERMQDTEGALRGKAGRYDYAGCPRVYGAFVRAARAFVMGSGSKYSKEEMARIIRSGASVHGTRLVYNMIHDQGRLGDENEGGNGQGGVEQESRQVADWRRFEKGLLLAERGLRSLQGTRKMKTAVALLEKLTKEVALGDGPQRDR